MGQKKYFHLTIEDRYKIETLLKCDKTKPFIADALGINKSTVYREINRNGGKRGGYNAKQANEFAAEKKERFNIKRKFTEKMKDFIKEKLGEEQWSPEQIVGYCRLNNIQMISHETIYKYIYEDKKNGGDLYKNLRIASNQYRKRYGKYDKRGKIKDKVSIEQRPDIVNNKERCGDWEADLIVGKRNKDAILTMVERKTLFTVITKTDGKKADSVKNKMINGLAPYKDLVFTITTDNGTEFIKHKIIANKLEADYYFAHPYSSWERGLNENTNGLIRQYIPKKISFENINQDFINIISNKLNNRPRKSLGFKTPLKVFMTNFSTVLRN
jgi:IS30 family transposase